MSRAIEASRNKSIQIASVYFARVWQKDKPEGGECVLVAMFLLDSDASDWVAIQNKSEGQDLYFFNPSKRLK